MLVRFDTKRATKLLGHPKEELVVKSTEQMQLPPILEGNPDGNRLPQQYWVFSPESSDIEGVYDMQQS
eukprot:gene8028-22776_t